MLAASKCPIKCKWHLQGWTGSVHLSVDQSCTRSPSTSQLNVFFFVASTDQCQNTLRLSGDSKTKARAEKTTKRHPGGVK